MKEILNSLKTEIARLKDIATGLQHQQLNERAACRRAEADRLQDIHDALGEWHFKWKGIFGQF